MGDEISRDLSKIILMVCLGCLLGYIVIFTEDVRTPLYIIFIVGIIIAMCNKPFLGILAFVFIYYFTPENHVSSATSAARSSFMISLVVLCSWMLESIRKKEINNKELFVSPQIIFLVLFLVWALLCTFTAYQISISWEMWVILFKKIIFCFLVLLLANSFTKVKLFIGMTVLGISYYSLDGFHSYLFAGDVGGIGGVNAGTNQLACLLVLTFPILFYMNFCKNGWVRKWGMLFAPMQVLTILLTASRGGMIGLITVFFVILIQIMRFKNWKGFIILSLLIALSVGMFLWSPILSKERDRVQSGIKYEQDTTAQQRITMWHIAWKMALDHPITGVGLDNFMEVQSNYGYLGRRLKVHNTYFQLSCELGFPGLFIYVIMLLIVLGSLDKTACRAVKGDDREIHYLALALQAGLCGFMVEILVIGRLFAEVPYWFIITAILLKKMTIPFQQNISMLEV